MDEGIIYVAKIGKILESLRIVEVKSEPVKLNEGESILPIDRDDYEMISHIKALHASVEILKLNIEKYAHMEKHNEMISVQLPPLNEIQMQGIVNTLQFIDDIYHQCKIIFAHKICQ